MTLYDLTKKIHAIFASNPNVRTVIEGDVYELNSIPDAEFGVGVITNNTSTLMTDEYVQYGFNLFAVDRLTSDDSNRLDVQSWAVQLLKDVISQLDEIGIFAVNEWQVQTFKERFAQSCSGAYVTVSFRVPYEDCNQFKLVTSVNGKVGDVVIDIPEFFTVTFDNARYKLIDNVPYRRFNGLHTNAKKISISEGCRFVDSYNFNDKQMEILELPNSLEYIGIGAFSGCTNITSVDLPSELTLMAREAFKGCSSLTSVDLPNGLSNINQSCFYDCKSLTNITIPNSVTSIGTDAFNNCTSLTSVTIPNSVTSIGTGAFYNIGMDVLYSDNGKFLCHVSSATTSFDIAEGTESICGSAFWGCTSLTSVTIPNSVTSIGSSAFYGCRSLTSVTYNGVAYDTKSELESALRSNNVVLGTNVFGNTGLK